MDREKLLKELKPFAEHIARAMCCPFYLVGSILTKEDPRDIDLYGRMEDRWFEIHFGPVADWEEQGKTGHWGRARHSWSRFCVVLTGWGIQMTGLNLDVQVKPASNFDRHIEERILVAEGLIPASKQHQQMIPAVIFMEKADGVEEVT